jgi:hypothetical protein
MSATDALNSATMTELIVRPNSPQDPTAAARFTRTRRLSGKSRWTDG